MDNVDLHPPDDYTHRFFIWHEWIQVGFPRKSRPPKAHSSDYQANGPLTAENIFDYFSHSMFYDKQSNNQVLRMQTMHTGQALENEAEELKYVISNGGLEPPFTGYPGIFTIGDSPALSSP